MTDTVPAYGLWMLVVINSALFILFAFSFSKPQTKRDWRSLGAFSAFVLALFTEMYGFPLTIYLLSGWLGNRYPALDPFSHEAGHLWSTLLGLKGDPHFNLLHLASNLLILGGFVVVAKAWHILHAAQSKGELATIGPYAVVRHPQYVGFVAVLLGFLLQWPTLLTLAMFPVLVVMYLRLAKIEEAETLRHFPVRYADYAAHVPAFIPHWGGGNGTAHPLHK
ncbi:isoprenylcysteine carboxylmethyltransferase family protein [Magnetospirillum sp. 64-120]|uniref:methyltransferase family protein n=1 Tax=Magnetospirillum sp. 64-120 TaxID=1895778 RepID=UPI00092A666C|nr:isoprenylcysteine carboxylmethyltransferase family protein [Magnetospirillum sp. 64-120]OJX77479.1 MAG: isoprenylcysteine carboxyl methyltransferase [Magnetospirillum sp. 64-120]